MADVHLGKQQYGRIERAEDFARAFGDVVNHSIETRVDFVLIAGDLFEQKTVDPETFNIAATGLHRLADANVPVFAIEGNHDKFLRHGAKTWVWYLGQQGLLHLLDIVDEDGTVAIRPWCPDAGGTYVDLDGVRIFGIGYYGARLPKIVEHFLNLAVDLPWCGIQHSICLLHTGVDDKVDYLHSGCTAAELLVLDRVIDYVALGHVHHHFSLPDSGDGQALLFNPGALENWSSREVGQTKGFFDVTVDTASSPKQQVRHVRDVAFSRAYLKLEVNVGDCATSIDLLGAVTKCVASYANVRYEHPVVELRLFGLLRFERNLIELAAYEKIIQDVLDCLVVRVVLDTIDPQSGGPAPMDLRVRREEFEVEVLARMFEQYDEFIPHARGLAQMARRLKSDSTRTHSAEAIVDVLTAELERAGILDLADN